MENANGDGKELAALQRAVVTINELRSQLDTQIQQNAEPIAIISMACRFPGGVNTPEAFWSLLCEGRETRSLLADDDIRDLGSVYGNFISSIEQFDPHFFGITPKDAKSMDPQHRLLLEVVWEAFERIGAVPSRMDGSKTGVFVGITANDYASRITSTKNSELLDAYFVTGNPLNAAAGRIAYTFGLRGPALAIDTACSASLVSVHMAMRSLRVNECRQAIAAGVNLMLSRDIFDSLAKARMLSPEGRCKTFSQAADGYARGEGAGVVLLKRLSDAVKDGDEILAVLRGSAINQDGPSSGFTVPSGPAQVELLRSALYDAKLEPSDISYLETHGTGTPLGDPIEVGSIAEVFRGIPQPLQIGAVKTNIGHLESAAGIAGLIKVVLSLRNRTIVPTLHVREKNVDIPWSTIPVVVSVEKQEWISSKPLRAGVSSFGASGTNAHLVLEEAPDKAAKSKETSVSAVPVALSAKSSNALKTYARAVAEHLRLGGYANLKDIAFSISTARPAFLVRHAFVATSIPDLISKLEHVANQEEFRSLARNETSSVVMSDGERDPHTLAELFNQGGAIDWRSYFGLDCSRLLLPTYPFERERCWFSESFKNEKLQPSSVAAATSKNPSKQPIASVITMQNILSKLQNTLSSITNISVERLDGDTNFFELGVDSLMLIQLQQAIVREFRVEIDLQAFTQQYDRLSAIAELIQSTCETSSVDTLLADENILSEAYPSSSMSELFKKQLAMLEESQRKVHTVIEQQIALLRGPQSSLTAAVTTSTAKRAEPVQVAGLYGKKKSQANELKPRQWEHLKKLTDRLTKKTKRSKDDAGKARLGSFAHNRNSFFRAEFKELTYLLQYERAEGARFWDIDGNEYLDITMGFGVHLFGHNFAPVREAISDELSRGIAVGPLSRVAHEAADLICEIAGTDRAAFLNTGSEAVMVAIRLARTVTGRSKIAIFAGSWHGSFDGVLATGSADGATYSSFPLAPGTTNATVADVIVLRYGDPKSLETIKLLGNEIAAVIVEPVQSRNPTLQPRDFVKQLREVTEETSSALIFDEMITGFRIEPGGAQAWYGIRADLVTYGKIIGGGQPIGVVAGTHRFMDALDGGVWSFGDDSMPTVQPTLVAGTFNMHPVTVAAARAVMRAIKEAGPKLQADLNAKTEMMCEELNAWYKQERFSLSMKSFSSLFRFDVSGEYELLYAHLLDRGIFVWEGRNCFLSTAHTDADVQSIITAIKDSLLEMRADGWLTDGDAPHKGKLYVPQLPLSYGQQEMSVLLMKDPASMSAYHESFLLRLQGKIQVDALQSAVLSLVDRHELLRATNWSHDSYSVTGTGGSPVSLLSATSDEQIATLVKDEILRPFDFVTKPLWRMALISLTDVEHRILFVAHHMIADGWSLGVIATELSELYEAKIKGREPKLPTAVPYSTFVAWEGSQKPKENVRKHWIALSNRDVPQWQPLARKRLPLERSYEGDRVRRTLSAQQVSEILKIARAHSVSFNALLFGVSELVLARASGEHRFLVGVPTVAFPAMGAVSIVGQGSAILPLECTVESNEPFFGVCRRIQDMLFAMQTGASGLRSSGAVVRQPTVVVNVDRQVKLRFADLVVELLDPAVIRTKADLFINLLQVEDELVVDFDFAQDSVEKSSVEVWASWFQDIVSLLAASAERLTKEELDALPVGVILPLEERPKFELRREGLQVELAEVESALSEITSARVALVKGQNGSKPTLIACIASTEFNGPEFHSKVARKLAPHEIPDLYFFCDSFPEADTDVSLRAALREMIEQHNPDSSAFWRSRVQYVAPNTKTEKLLVDIVQSVIGVEKLSVLADFWESGGRSLTAVQVVARLRKALARDVQLKLLFDHPVLRDLSAAIDEQVAERKSALTDIVQRARGDVTPLSKMQERLWFIHSQYHSGAAYNLAKSMRISGELSCDLLRKAFDVIVERHEILRTRFIVREDLPYQVILPAQDSITAIEDLTGVEYSSAVSKAMELYNREASHVFSLENDPLVRVTLIKLSPQETILIVVMHHMISDGWSEGVFFREVSAAYEALLKGKSPQFEPLKIQYGDFSIWQRKLIDSDSLAEQREYWRDTLTGSPEWSGLPTDYSRPPIQEYDGGRVHFKFSSDLGQLVRSFCAARNVTPYAVFATAFVGLLSRYSGERDLVIGTAVAGRPKEELESLIGFFVTTLPMRWNLEGNPSFVDLLEQTRKLIRNGLSNAELPFDSIVEVIKPRRSASYPPLCQVLFAYQDMPISTKQSFAGLKVSPFVEQSTVSSKFDLSIEIGQAEDSFTGYFEYVSALYERKTIEQFANRFVAFIEGVVLQPTLPIVEVPLISELESSLLSRDWVGEVAEYPFAECIHTAFEESRANNSDKVAVLYEGQKLTFEQLSGLSNRMAHYLIEKGVGRGDVVGVYLERSPQLVFTLLGILKAGAAYLPLDPAYPRDRVTFMIEDAMPKVIVATSQNCAELSRFDGTLIRIDTEKSAIAKCAAESPEVRCDSSDTAYIVYTSGSTGRPKGVCGTHRGMLNRFSWMWKAFPFQDGERVAQRTSYNFVDSIWETFGPLLKGIPLVIVPAPITKDPPRLVEFLSQEKVTRIVLVPSLLRAILELPEADLRSLSGLIHWTSSGEALPGELVVRFYEVFPDSILLNLYGSSEVAADCTWFDTRLPYDGKSVPLGRAIPNNRLYVLDSRGQTVPPGMAGELYVGGVGLANGYLHRAELTAERFIPDTFAGESNAKMFKTGDRVRFGRDGIVEYLGRMDHQVKIRGFRVEIGEIEKTFIELGLAKQCIVITFDHPKRGAELVAYVVPFDRDSAEERRIKESLSQKLPDYMVPATIVLLQAMPLTPNGKIDRLSLPKPQAKLVVERIPDLSSQTERLVAEIFGEVLGESVTSCDADFFDLGGHSLLATKVLTRIRERTGCEISMQQFFTDSTVKGIACHLPETAALQTAPSATQRRVTGRI